MCDGSGPVPHSARTNRTTYPLFVVEQRTSVALLTYDVAAWVSQDFHFESSQQQWWVAGGVCTPVCARQVVPEVHEALRGQGCVNIIRVSPSGSQAVLGAGMCTFGHE